MEDERSDSSLQEIVGDSPALKRLLQLAMKVGANDFPVLILGEAGSGKESIARAIHRISFRRNESFVKVNCVRAAGGRLGPELFGEAKDALDDPASRGTGGVERGRIGYVELAQNGILFLDEIAHLPLDLQATLLRMLQGRAFEPFGSMQRIPVNVRLIASTKYDLGERVADHMFLGDLYEPLNTFPIRVPPLRERRADIPSLARYFMQKFARRMNKQIESIPAETMTSLMNFAWPGNVRQLENLIERAVVLTDGPELRVPPNLALNSDFLSKPGRPSIG